MKEYRREKRKERKRKERTDEGEEEDIDPEMAAMMGFGSFGTKRKA